MIIIITAIMTLYVVIPPLVGVILILTFAVTVQAQQYSLNEDSMIFRFSDQTPTTIGETTTMTTTTDGGDGGVEFGQLSPDIIIVAVVGVMALALVGAVSVGRCLRRKQPSYGDVIISGQP